MQIQFKRQIIKYLITGVTCTTVDSIIYFILLSFQFSINFSKACGVFTSVLFGYFINRKWTFKVNSSILTIIKYWFVYGISIIINIYINSFVINLLKQTENILLIEYALVFAFLIATFVSMCINFTGLKLWVFKK